MILYNGKLTNDMKLFSGDILLNISVFETLTVNQGIALDLDAHLDRLFSSLDFFHLKLGISKTTLISQIDYFTRKIEEEMAALRILAIKSKQREQLDLVISQDTFPYKKQDYENGFKIKVSNIIRHHINPLLYHKTTNYLLNKIVLEEAKSKGYDEAIFLNENGNITEGTRSNIFIITDGIIYTPKSSCGLLEGVTRNKIIKLAKQLSMDVIIDSFDKEKLENCSEAFLTSSLLGVMPVSLIGNRKLSIDKYDITSQLMSIVNLKLS